MTAKTTQFGNYQIVRKIASGGMAEVYEAYRVGSENFQVRVALKVIRTELTANERFLRMFINEAHLGSQLHHPNIVQIQDFNRVEETYYIAMEYVEGTDLAQFMQRVQLLGEPLPRPVILDIALQALAGLGYAHSARSPDGTPMNIVHRDLKPSNFLINLQGTVKIADFGIAKASTNTYQTQTQDHIKGTLKYMSPEQVDGAPLTPTSDIFSLAVILYELATFKELFDSPGIASTLIKIATTNISQDLKHLDGIWAEFGAALRHVLHRDPEKRLENSAEVSRALRTLERPFAIEGALERYLRRHPGLFELSTAANPETLNIPRDLLGGGIDGAQNQAKKKAKAAKAAKAAREAERSAPDTDQLPIKGGAAAQVGASEGAAGQGASPPGAFEGILNRPRERGAGEAAPPPVMGPLDEAAAPLRDLGTQETVRGRPIKPSDLANLGHAGGLDDSGDGFDGFDTAEDPTFPPGTFDDPSSDEDLSEAEEPAEGIILGVSGDSDEGRFPAFLGTPAPEEPLVPGSQAHRNHRFQAQSEGAGIPDAAAPPEPGILPPGASDFGSEIASDFTFEEEALPAARPLGQDPFAPDPALQDTDSGPAAQKAAAAAAAAPAALTREPAPHLDAPEWDAPPAAVEAPTSRRGLFAGLAVLLMLGLAAVIYTLRPAPPVQPASLQIKTRPPGAVVYINQKQMQERTPTILQLPVDGTQALLELRADGFEPYTETLVFEPGQTLKRDIGMSLETVEPGSLSLKTTPPGASILLDGAPTGKTTPTTLAPIQAGVHALTLELEGYEPMTLGDLEILPGKTLDRAFQLTPIERAQVRRPVRNVPRRPTRAPAVQEPKGPVVKGDVLINSRPPDARVFLDGKLVGEQVPLKLSLPVGRYTMRLELGDQQKTHSFEVKEGQAQKLVWDFTSGAWITR